MLLESSKMNMESELRAMKRAEAMEQLRRTCEIFLCDKVDLTYEEERILKALLAVKVFEVKT